MITIDQTAFDDNGTDSTFTATGGAPPYTFSVIAGVMPAGLKLNSDGSVSGTTIGGPHDVTIRATDSSLVPHHGDRQYVGILTGGHIIPILKR